MSQQQDSRLRHNFKADADKVDVPPGVQSLYAESAKEGYVRVLLDVAHDTRLLHKRRTVLSRLTKLTDEQKLSDTMLACKLPPQLLQDRDFDGFREKLTREHVELNFKCACEAKQKAIDEAASKVTVEAVTKALRSACLGGTEMSDHGPLPEELTAALETYFQALLKSALLSRDFLARNPVRHLIIEPTDCPFLSLLDNGNDQRSTAEKSRFDEAAAQQLREEVKAKQRTSSKAGQRRARRRRAKAKRSATTATNCPSSRTAVIQNGKAAEEIVKEMIERKDYSMNNLTRIKPPPEIERLLGKGLNYIPELRIRPDEIKKDFHAMSAQIVRKLSDLPEGTDLARYVQHMTPFFAEELVQDCRAYSISEETENKLIKDLGKFMVDNNVVCVPADKNLGLTIMDKDVYDQAVLAHLGDTSTYLCKEPDWEQIKGDLLTIVERYDAAWYRFPRIWNENHTPAKFRLMPKLHKQGPLKYRPIVGCSNAATTGTSKYLTEALGHLQKTIPWLMQDTTEAIQFLERTELPRHTSGIVTIDVVNLYTNIPTERGIRVFKAMLLKSGLHPFVYNYYTELLTWVLKNNYFKYKDQWYVQIKGTAMGTNVAPLYANLYLAHYEQQWMQIKSMPRIMCRYLDDMIAIIEEDQEFLDSPEGISATRTPAPNRDAFLSLLDTATHAEFTYEICEYTGVFLDLEISIPDSIWKRHRNARAHMKPYVKPMNKGLYTDPSTYQPTHQKFSWIGGEMIRLLRSSSTEQDWIAACKDLIMKLLQRGYDPEIIRRYSRYSWNDRNRYLQPASKRPHEVRIIAVTTNIPGRHLLQDTAKRMLQMCTLVTRKETDAPLPDVLLATKRGANLFNLLCKMNEFDDPPNV